MIAKKIVSIVILLITFSLSSQENLYQSLILPENLTKNANAILRVDDTQINISSVKSLNHLYRRVITILNKKGNKYISSYVHYDDEITIKKLRAVVYNKFGKEIKKFKKNDFKDVAAVSSFSLYEDNRVKYLEYTPIEYPYTIEFEYETETSNTAWVPFWRPLEGYLISTQNSSFKIIYDASVGINKKEKNFSGYNIIDNSKAGILEYEAKNIEALKPEQMSPAFRAFGPRLLVSAKHFHYGGFYGNAEDWTSLGKWFNDNLLIGRSTLTESTVSQIKKLVTDIDDPIEKAKIVYEFVQDNTRYISVQVGVGGMQPISALDVDKVKYGDCKGLTNYTKALLDVVGVPSNYTRLYASPDSQIGVEKDFTSFVGQTNHVILNIPQEDKDDIWLECTSQKLPFGFIGDFTDDRDVLVITPEGGKIQHTKKYRAEESIQQIKGNYVISSNGAIDAKININSKGIQYDDKYWLETETERNLDTHYKKRWKYINSIKVNNMQITNDKEAVEFIEDISFQATNYSKKIGDRMLLTLNALNRNTDIPDRYRNRKHPLKIKRGFTDIDEVEITLPQEYKVESKPNSKNIENKFGSYKAEVVIKDENTLIYKRKFVVKDGEFPKEDYEAYRNFYKEVNKQDNAKVALIKK